MKCQDEYEEARHKYHSFYEASKGLNHRANSRGHSFDGGEDEDRKADIFIS